MTKNAIRPIPRSTLSSIVTERLREIVVGGAYPPGTQLSEVELAEQFGVSRGPIREGLQRLVQEGLLRSEPHRGVFVPTMDAEDVRDVYLAREVIECAAVRALMAGAVAPAVVASLRQIVKAMDEAHRQERWARMAELDMKFHLELVHAAGSERLDRMYAALIDETRMLLSMTTTYSSHGALVAGHTGIVEAIASGDPAVAEETVHEHLTISSEAIGTQVDELAGR